MSVGEWIGPALEALRGAQSEVAAGRSGRFYSCLLVIAHGIFPVPQNDVRVNLVIDEPLLTTTRAFGKRRCSAPGPVDLVTLKAGSASESPRVRPR
jgi:hypothetical protein